MPKLSKNQSIKTVDKRVRNFACIVYPDSAPDDWLCKIAESKIPVLISPLHCNDVNPDGEQKKPHFHILVAYEGKKSLSQFEVFRDSFGGVGLEEVQSLRGYARYLCHLDNPEKYQYDTSKVLAYGGIDYLSTIGLPTDRYKVLEEIMDYCDTNRILSYRQLMQYCRTCHYDWFRVLCDSGTYVVKEYLKSALWELENSLKSHALTSADSAILLEKSVDAPNTVAQSSDVIPCDDIEFQGVFLC